MYRCLNCNREFDEPIIIKNHPINDEFYEEEEVCPFCHNYYEEIEGEDNDKHEIAAEQ